MYEPISPYPELSRDFLHSLPVLMVYAESPVESHIIGATDNLSLKPTEEELAENTEREEHSILLLKEIRRQLEREGFAVQELKGYTDCFDLSSQQHFSAFIFVLPSSGHRNAQSRIYELLDTAISQIRCYGEKVPIFLYGRQKDYQLLSENINRNTTGFIHYGEETVEFISRYISREARNYLQTILPAFFRNLMEYVYNGSYSWHCPGHSGGTAFLKSPVGRVFHQFFGENLLRADVCNAVEHLGQLLGHTGLIGLSERNAAHVFHADRLYFVTNGTSTSNKIVAHAHIAYGNIVLVDRNCHQSILHAIIQTGAIPIFLWPSRNAYGIVGPIPQESFRRQSIETSIRESPLVRALACKVGQKAKKTRPNIPNNRGLIQELQEEQQEEQIQAYITQLVDQGPKAMILTQSTYDGILYNTELIKEQLDGYIPILHFDEAWIPHATFHEFYFAMHAMGPNRPAPKYSTVYSTQSTHKLLAGLSQASQILVQNASSVVTDPSPLEASFLMYTSTSPQYSILASLDVTAAMMSGSCGRAIVEEALIEALSFRQALRKYGENLGAGTWWFCDWGPPYFNSSNPCPDNPCPKWNPAEELYQRPQHEPQSGALQYKNQWQEEWLLEPGQPWHGFRQNSAQDRSFNMLDPLKCTLLTPGLGEDGRLQENGIPAVVVGRYLQENGIIVEKTGLYSIFVMFTIGITKGRWKSLLSALKRFKADYDTQQSLWQSMPELCRQYPKYAALNICELCQMLHEYYQNNCIVEQTHRAYSRPLSVCTTPNEAYQYFIRGEYERLNIKQIAGRTCASMISIYPPGIPLVFPGEVISKEIQHYLSCIQQQQAEFPGFEIHIHGVNSVSQLQKRANDVPNQAPAWHSDTLGLETSGLDTLSLKTWDLNAWEVNVLKENLSSGT